MDYINSDKLIFICASPAGAGYRLGRIISCLNNVYWYQNKRNGKYPWSTNYFSTNSVQSKGREVSKFHYDRVTEKNMIPLVGERVERFWNFEDLDYYYQKVWTKLMNDAGGSNIINNRLHLTWVVHDTPNHILNIFPNSKIINLIDENIEDVAKRYLSTTALFPITIENKNIKPDYQNQYSLTLSSLQQLNETPTYQDFWMWKNYTEPVYNNLHDNEYYRSILSELLELDQLKRKQTSNCLNFCWSKFDVNLLINFLKSKEISNEYIDLLH
jgi:hypothetical protein